MPTLDQNISYTYKERLSTSLWLGQTFSLKSSVFLRYNGKFPICIICTIINYYYKLEEADCHEILLPFDEINNSIKHWPFKQAMLE